MQQDEKYEIQRGRDQVRGLESTLHFEKVADPHHLHARYSNNQQAFGKCPEGDTTPVLIGNYKGGNRGMRAKTT
jgi:hypothetical protein